MSDKNYYNRAAIDQSFCSQLVPRNNPYPGSHQLTKWPDFLARQIHCVQCKKQHSCHCASEDDTLLQLIVVWEGCVCMYACIYRAVYNWSWDTASFQLCLPKKGENSIALHKMNIGHTCCIWGLMSQKTNCTHWYKLAPYENRKSPRHCSADSVQSICTPSWDLSSWLPGAPCQYFKVGVLELSAMLAAAAKPHINVTPHSARQKMFGFWVY